MVWYAADHGGRSIVSTPTYAGSGALQALVSDMFDRVVYQEIPVVAGQTMTASAWLQTSGVVAGASIDLMWLNATGLSDSPSANNIVRTDLVGTVTGTTPWTNLAGQFVAPAGAKCVRVRLYTKKAPTPTGAAWFDEIFLQ